MDVNLKMLYNCLTLALCVTGIWTTSTTVFAREELQTDGDGAAESVQLHESYRICEFFIF
jgi:hypothetical protein